MSFFRYPGGKAKLSEPILNEIKTVTANKSISLYIEPFFGGGSICFKVLEEKVFPDLMTIIVNDKDIGIFSIWDSVFHHTEKLKDLIKSYHPSVEDFYNFKDDLLTCPNRCYDTLNIGLKKIALHQMSYSGLGVKAGGPIGGVSQQSNYAVDCRWSPDHMIKKIDKIKKLVNGIYPIVFNQSFEDLFHIYGANEKTFFYVDPPYFDKGSDLYLNAFSIDDHIKLSKLLANTSNWVLSYDDCPEIRDLYSWATIKEINVNYTIRTARNKNELLISR